VHHPAHEQKSLDMMFTPFLAFFLGPWEIGGIALVALLVFGKRLPEVGKSLGEGIVAFKRSIGGVTNELTSVSDSVKSDPPSDQPNQPEATQTTKDA
jgi:sec-independent protein translocase protein TatA